MIDMAIADLHQRVRQVVYGQGLGEKPPFRRAASDANESLSGEILTFSLLAGEGADCRPGDVLSVYTTTAADMHVLYVISVATDIVTAVNGYLGSPLVVGSNSGDLDNVIFEQRGLVTSFEIDGAIDTVFANLLWDDVYDIVTATIASPSLTHGQEAVAAEVEDIISAWQIVGTEAIGIAVSPKIPYEVDSTLASTGKLVTFDWINGSTGRYTYRAKYTEADETDTEITFLVALGASALLLGASISQTSLPNTRNPNTPVIDKRTRASSLLWRDFLTLRQNMGEEQSKRPPARIYIDRG